MLLYTPGQYPREIAQRVRRLRLEAGWSQKEMARRSGIPFGTYQVFEHSGRINLQRLYQISIALGRHEEFDNLLKPLPYRTLKDIEPKPLRKRGRTARTQVSSR